MTKEINRQGFTLIELLVVIAIIAILAAILFPVFARAREKARQTTCTSNQRSIAAAIQMYAQDHEETFPSTGTIWSDIKVDPGVLVCPTKGKSTTNGYVYSQFASNAAMGKIDDPTVEMLIADGVHAVTATESAVNIAYTINDFDKRHSNAFIVAYADGHVGTATMPTNILFVNPSALYLTSAYDSATNSWTNSWPDPSIVKYTWTLTPGGASNPTIGAINKVRAIGFTNSKGLRIPVATLGYDIGVGSTTCSVVAVRGTNSNPNGYLSSVLGGDTWRIEAPDMMGSRHMVSTTVKWALNDAWANGYMPTDANYIGSFVFNGGGKFYMYNNGEQMQFKNDGSDNRSNYAASTYNYIGWASYGGNYYYGCLGDYVFFNRAITDTERKFAEACLSKKWGISLLQ